MKINYLIACAAHRAGRVKDYGFGIEGKRILRLHLRELAKTDTSKLSQITIIRALPLLRSHPEESAYYWDVDDLIGNFSCPVKILDVPDSWWSYSSWIHACQEYKDTFDYYILCEDDYYPIHKNFSEVLVDLHSRKLPNGGYLNSFTTDHGAVSNGIVDSKSFLEGIRKHKDPIKAISAGAQRLFATMLFKDIADYTDEYRCLGWFGSGEIYKFVHKDKVSAAEDIFVPIQYLGSGEKEFPISIYHGE